jgi:succinate dehydrogenase / fumarate reductase cytochrome b subunit
MTYKRPISPHLQIYNIFSASMTSGPSFLNRATGSVLAVGLIYLCAWLLCAAMGKQYYDGYIVFITSWFGWLSLVGISAAFYYHISNGIRFLLFSFGYLLTKKQLFVSGVAMITIALALFFSTWGYVLFVNLKG